VTIRVLGIETSCDETAAAVVEDGCRVLSDVVSTQIEIHRRWGGVVPELASRNHVVQVMPVVDEAVTRAGGPAMVDAIAADCTGYLAGAPGVTSIIGGGNTALDGSVSAAGVNGVVAKALWNTVLVQDDASRGVHNPGFTFDVIDATLAHVGTFTK